MYSRRLKIEEAKNKKRAIFFILLTILSVLIIFFYGLPAVIKFAAFLTEINQSSLPVDTNDTTPPSPPRLNSLPSATKDENIDIRGKTEPGVKIILSINDNEKEIISDSEGNFLFTYKLSKGENYFFAKSIDTAGNESQRSDTQIIIYDTEPPSLEIIKPEDQNSYYGAKERQIIIEGKTEANSRVQINQRWIVVENDGIFTYSITLQEGNNLFTVTSEDIAGNKSEKTFSVNFNL